MQMPSPNQLHLYIAEGKKSFRSVYSTNVSVQPLLHSSVLQCFPLGQASPQVPLPWRYLNHNLIRGFLVTSESSA